MGVIRALIIGVSQYDKNKIVPANDLPFCKNDIAEITSAFINGLKVDPSDIISCGKSGIVLHSDVDSALQQLSKVAETDDTLLIYFSGHGGTIKNNHHLILSDDSLQTQKLINHLEQIAVKNKILFLDCCKSGAFSVGNTTRLNINGTADEFVGKGYAVLASSSATQPSYCHPMKEVSLFTNFLCEALTKDFLSREGKKSLYDIYRLLSTFLDAWNLNHPDESQKSIYRGDICGTIFFEIQEYHPYIVKDFFEETKQYIIYTVDPIHSSIAKRYAVKVILKEPFSLSEISNLNHEIIEKVANLDIYKSEQQEQHWHGKPANIIFCYFGFNETDMIHANYLYRTTWADSTQDKNKWYTQNKSGKIVNDIYFNANSNSSYEQIKKYIEEHTGSRDELIVSIQLISAKMIELAEQVIALYNEFLNHTNNELEFIKDLKEIIPEINKLYSEYNNLAILPDDLSKWKDLHSCIVATIHDFTLYFNAKPFSERTLENRKICMDLAIKQYYKELNELREYESRNKQLKI